jgi:Ca2+-binding EF-hand superfamily protein
MTLRLAICAVCALPFALTTAADAQGNRFSGMDSNRDGMITREEWRGSDRSFQVHDWNGDGRLSGDEVRPGARRSGSYQDDDFDPPAAARSRYWNDTAFADLDHNRDGRLSRSEWHYDAASFFRSDRNRDGLLSRAEFLDAAIEDDRDDQFDYLDLNGNQKVERREWHGDLDTFQWLDRNRDNVLTRTEIAGTANDTADQFTSIDFNGDGRVALNEWHWSRRSFDQRDVNNDGYLTRGELYTAANSAVGTSGQLVRVDPAQRWTDTGLYVRAGDMVTFSADGSITMSTTDRSDVSTPAGSHTGRRAQSAPLPDQPAGALIAQFGNSAPVLVGADRVIRAPASGRILLGVNDDHLPDNSGDYRVTINIQGQ